MTKQRDAKDDLARVEHDIDEARREAMDAGIIDDPDKQRFYDSGDRSDVDDQTIAP